MIEVRQIDDTTFEVSVAGRSNTRHRVTVAPAYYQQLTDGQVPAQTLVEKSFEFLLQREPNTAILQQFDLTVIGRYFPEYEREIQRLLS
jgi:hypothetical protein